VCFAPVLGLDEVPAHPHHQARQSFIEVGGVSQPAPAPRFSRTPGSVRSPAAAPGANTDTALADWGFSAGEIAELRAGGAVG
jgi:alpha-methylacyl-CoA racemase